MNISNMYKGRLNRIIYSLESLKKLQAQGLTHEHTEHYCEYFQLRHRGANIQYDLLQQRQSSCCYRELQGQTWNHVFRDPLK